MVRDRRGTNEATEIVSKSLSGPSTHRRSGRIPELSIAKPVSASQKESRAMISRIPATYHGTYDLQKYYKDKTAVKLSGRAVANDGRKFITDSASSSVELFSRSMKLLSTLYLMYQPVDVAFYGSKDALVTTTYNHILLIDISDDTLSVKHVVKTAYSVHGIAVCEGNIFVTCPASVESPSVKRIEITGNVIWSLSHDKTGPTFYMSFKAYELC